MQKILLRFGILVTGILLCLFGFSSSGDIASILNILGVIFILVGLFIASKSSMLGIGKDLQTTNGIGTTLYGISDTNQDAIRAGTKYRFPKAKHALQDYHREMVRVLGQEEADRRIANLRVVAAEMVKRGTPIMVIFNKTFSGGGVAAMLQKAGILAELGLEIEWHITFERSEKVADITKRIHNAHQGVDGECSDEDFKIVEQMNADAAYMYRGIWTDKRVARTFFEDPQVVSLIKFVKRYGIRAAWRLHIDISGLRARLPNAMRIWAREKEYLSLLDENDVLMFQPFLVPDDLEGIRAHAFVQVPGIDILDDKNIKLSHDEMADLIEKINREKGSNPAPGMPQDPDKPWTDIDITKLVIVTGARLDYWKGIPTVIRAFEARAGRDKDMQLIVYGNFADDDPEGKEHYELVKHMILHSQYRDRIHFVTNYSGREIGAMNCLAGEHRMYYIADSLREGANLMVYEASRQGTVPMPSNVGGMNRFEDSVNAVMVDIADVADTVTDASQLYVVRDGHLHVDSKAEELERRLLAVWDRTIFGLRLTDPAEYNRQYDRMVPEAEKKTVRDQLLDMLTDYGAFSLAEEPILAAASQSQDGQTPTPAGVLDLVVQQIQADAAAHGDSVAGTTARDAVRSAPPGVVEISDEVAGGARDTVESETIRERLEYLVNHARTARTYAAVLAAVEQIRDNYYTPAFKSDANWDWAVDALRDLSDINQYKSE